jgi:hypothetical protein
MAYIDEGPFFVHGGFRELPDDTHTFINQLAPTGNRMSVRLSVSSQNSPYPSSSCRSNTDRKTTSHKNLSPSFTVLLYRSHLELSPCRRKGSFISTLIGTNSMCCTTGLKMTGGDVEEPNVFRGEFLRHCSFRRLCIVAPRQMMHFVH